jgi:hypothetical protein
MSGFEFEKDVFSKRVSVKERMVFTACIVARIGLTSCNERNVLN